MGYRFFLYIIHHYDEVFVSAQNYNQPEVHVAQIALESMVLAGSPAPSANTMGIIDSEGEQW